VTPNNFMIGVALGASLLFLLDPQSGRRRRARARDKVVHWSRKGRDSADVMAKDLANRTRGVISATRGRLMSHDIDDVRLLERVRSKLGRVASHPRAIEVEVDRGDVTLRGPILNAEADNVMRTVAAVPGVRTVTNLLELHDTAEGLPALQGEGRITGPMMDVLQRKWAPATQALVAVTGLAATGLCLAALGRRAS
jgi:hypothetical protein